MKLALYQGPSPAGDIDKAFDAVSASLQRAAADGAVMMVFPELFLPGYNVGAVHHDVAQQFNGPWVKRLSGMARAAECGLVIGFPERDGLTVYNSAVAINANGELLARYRKIQLFGEKETALFAPGESYATFDWKGRKVGLLICYDIEFPEHVRALRRLGAELILVPTANMEPFSFVSRTMVPSRAHENAVSIAYANYCGVERDLSYVGLSVIVAADGTVLQSAGTDDETMLLANLHALRGEKKLLSTQLEDFRAIRTPFKQSPARNGSPPRQT